MLLLIIKLGKSVPTVKAHTGRCHIQYDAGRGDSKYCYDYDLHSFK